MVFHMNTILLWSGNKKIKVLLNLLYLLKLLSKKQKSNYIKINDLTKK